MMDDSGLPESTCSCPYAIDCKHGVALVIEYLQRVEKEQPISKAKNDDERIRCLEDAYRDEDLNDDEYSVPESIQQDIDHLLKGQTKAQLIELIRELASHHPEMARELSERRQLDSGNVKTIMAHLRREIHDVGAEPGWQNYWQNEIIPLCIAETKRTNNYDRLVKHLVAAQCYDDAGNWIRKGIKATREKWPGIAAGLRKDLMDIRIIQKNWPAVTAMQVENFVHRPSRTAFIDCKKASEKTKAWTRVRTYLLRFLEKGELPWKQGDWAFPLSGLYQADQDRKKHFPLVNDLIDIALYEKKPDQVLKWYDQLRGDRFGWYGVDEDAVAVAIKNHAPDQAVDVWKNMAERLIAQVKPKAYQAAAKYLAKAAKVMSQIKKQVEWGQYLQGLRKQHFRKRRLLEILDALEDKPILARPKKDQRRLPG